MAQVSTDVERGRVQGAADLVTTSLVALASLTAGSLHSQFGWEVMVMTGCLPITVLAFVLVWFGFHQR